MSVLARGCVRMSGDATASGPLYVRVDGDGSAALLLLHGMGATGAVWRGVVAALAGRWAGRVVVCDLPGHGASARLEDYSPAAVATALARGLSGGGPMVVAGHSYGGDLALLLASGHYGLDVTAGMATGVKVNWTPDELDRAATFAARPASWFDSFADAEARYRKVAGLTDDVTNNPEDLARGVVLVDGRFCLSHDPRSAGVGAPDMASALHAASAPVLLSRGVADPMVSREELLALAPVAIDIPGGGHSIHVQHPKAFVDHLLDFVTVARALGN
jgi:pimeloyl-ACP methyl ester carboxylesterase